MKILIFVFLFAQSLSAATLVVSDVDDTIKNSSVLDLDSAGANLVYDKFDFNEFLGMAKLYRLINMNNKNTTFKYLSNGIDALAGERHQKFLSTNGYPAGDLDMNMTSFIKRVSRHFRHQEEDGPGHKITKLREYLKGSSYDRVILIGDNGERDIEIYNQITKEFPTIKFHTYIHVVYATDCKLQMCGKKLEENQTAFVTSYDLALQLFELGLLDKKSVEQVAELIHRNMYIQGFGLKRGQPIIFPAWTACPSFKFPADLAEKATEGSGSLAEDIAKNIATFTQVRCSIPLISK